RAGLQAIVASNWIAPAVIFRRLESQNPNIAWLDSGPNATTGWSFICPADREPEIGVNRPAEQESLGQAVRNALQQLRVALSKERRIGETFEPDLNALDSRASQRFTAPFQLGVVGWLGFEASSATLGVNPKLKSRYQDCAFFKVSRMIAFDHKQQAVWLVAENHPESEKWLLELWRMFDEPSTQPEQLPSPPPFNVQSVWHDSDSDYLEKIQVCKEHIRNGDAYQLCLTNEASVGGTIDEVETYFRLREANPSHHGGIVRIGSTSLISSSPEVFLSATAKGKIFTSPIKGTRPRGKTPAEDEALKHELQDDPKERAENIMIVDLVRNDLGRTCLESTIRVERLCEVESYPKVHQLVSTVSGMLRPECETLDAIEALFPAGSMTGAPKIRSVELLSDIESRPRGIYSGVFGWIGYDGACELAMVIRSIVIDENGATVGSGGGITASSIAESELAEVKLKARVLLEALGANVR
ncbi:MAG: anthranilate synthase component I family protein, partial [Cryobacterium sp.]|nr:anthranilate synthase component I family protein [Cryobacterium sp.]